MQTECEKCRQVAELGDRVRVTKAFRVSGTRGYTIPFGKGVECNTIFVVGDGANSHIGMVHPSFGASAKEFAPLLCQKARKVEKIAVIVTDALPADRLVALDIEAEVRRRPELADITSPERFAQFLQDNAKNEGSK